MLKDPLWARSLDAVGNPPKATAAAVPADA
jgi:hypothetical protein